ncbi:hypothetical protein SAPIO_CDS5325 [Scedosporium apiospermum]|uniref:Integral membrane protein n=1 Tax=Pseudallescheria apiosperma TaxID=563466 RepID=A0A084G6D0_PSEDA|nr:uncharacterized protein SAPIO_CDS5325 [Scedosporium apiospermum]KEZ42892.1 hypothetical protein SAPIO_CDS5325 [Scedosporium apiospermum]
MASKTDYQLASLAAGFTLGFGFLTVWEAIKQTRRNRNPTRSAYIYMVWGEIVANLAIGIIGWLFLDGVLGPTFVEINKYWDRISKVLILLVDAGLNWYFLRIVKVRLVSQHGLAKYKPLVGFNAKLMVLSICMDVMLIGLMSLKNQVVFVQFHPVAYMVKLNIEMSMASLITRLAAVRHNADFSSLAYSGPHRSHTAQITGNRNDDMDPEYFQGASIELRRTDEELGKMQGGICRRFDVEVRIDSPKSVPSNEARSYDEPSSRSFGKVDDEVTLTH